MKELVKDEDLQACVEASESRPVFIFKHSTRCPISARADNVVRDYAASATADAPEVYRVLVVESRPLSLQVASELGVEHQSPQLILVDHGKAVWSASHYSITGEAITAALQKAEAKS